MIYSPRYFRLEEFRCKCCGNGLPSTVLVMALDMLRKAWGQPIVVNSAYRCQKHNHEVHGAAKSRHMLGCAADIAPSNRDIATFKQLVHEMYGDLEGWEIKLNYDTFVHLAVPRELNKLQWRGGDIEVTVAA